MGVVCCAQDSEGLVSTTDIGDGRKPQLFGTVHHDSESDNESDGKDATPVEERLRELIPRIRAIKQQMDGCLKQQIKLKEEVLSQKTGNVAEILEAVNQLRQRTDGRQIEMTQECEKILNAAEKIQKEKNLVSRVSYNSLDGVDPLDMLREHEENIGQYQTDLKEVQDQHKSNAQKWSLWQTEQVQSLTASKDMAEKIKKQLEQGKKVNVNMTKMLAEISNHVSNFKALDDCVKKAEVAVDYRDLDYESKLDFVDGVEPPLQYVSQVLVRAKSLIDDLEKQFSEAEADKENSGPQVTQINAKLRDDEDLQVIAQQEGEVKKTLLDLKERRKRFTDCSVRQQLTARKQIMTRIHQLFDATQEKFRANKSNVEGLLSLDSTKPKRKQILQECKDNELVDMDAKISQFDGVWKKMNATYDALDNEIGDFGELLKDCELKVCCGFIERLAEMQTKLKNLRHAVTDMDSAIDLMKVKIGELDVNEATQGYLQQKTEILSQLTTLNTKAQLLLTYAKECEAYASDDEEKELAENTHTQIESFLMSVSPKQAEVVDEKLTKLEKTNRDYAKALNKEDVKEGAFKLIGELEKLFARMNERVETGWTSLQKKYLHFSDFDLFHKQEKRASKHAKCETLTVQIKENISQLLLEILEKLDSNISKEDRTELKQIQLQTQEFQKEIQRYLNINLELGRELSQLRIPTMSKQVQDLDHFDSIETQLQEMKTFGEKLKLSELRMATIKDKIEIYSSQVSSLMEQPVVEESKTEAVNAPVVYAAVDAEDPLDLLVSKAMTEKFAGVTIQRQTPGLYLIQGKSVTLMADGENLDHLKARVGSSWLDFADYMTQVKAKLDREGEGEEESTASMEVKATLEDAPAEEAKTAASAAATPGKTKKKKKKAKKNPAAELDLDMDNDDASEQTRFAGLVKTPKSAAEAAASGSGSESPSKGAQRRNSKRKSGKMSIAGGLQELAEVSEGEDSDEE